METLRLPVCRADAQLAEYVWLVNNLVDTGFIKTFASSGGRATSP